MLAFGIGGGTLAYATLGGGTGTLVITDRQGNLRPLPNLPPGDYNGPRVSPDGQQIAVMKFGPTGGRDVWVYRMPAGPLTQLTRTGDALLGGWLGDGARIAYTRTGRDGDVFWRRSDGAGDEDLLLHRDRMGAVAAFPDGRQLVYGNRDRLLVATVASIAGE